MSIGGAVEAAHEEGCGKGQCDAEQDASAAGDNDLEGDVAGGDRRSAGSREQSDEKDCPDAVIEERFAGELGLQMPWSMDAAKHLKNCDGIGG